MLVGTGQASTLPCARRALLQVAVHGAGPCGGVAPREGAHPAVCLWQATPVRRPQGSRGAHHHPVPAWCPLWTAPAACRVAACCPCTPAAVSPAGVAQPVLGWWVQHGDTSPPSATPVTQALSLQVQGCLGHAGWPRWMASWQPRSVAAGQRPARAPHVPPTRLQTSDGASCGAWHWCGSRRRPVGAHPSAR